LWRISVNEIKLRSVDKSYSMYKYSKIDRKTGTTAKRPNLLAIISSTKLASPGPAL